MKHKYAILAGLFLFASHSFSQTFTDNFDSYTAGSKLAAQSSGAWTTWSNAPGGSEDPLVSNADAHSAPNSVYFSSAVEAGGPVDCIRNFGGTYNTGTFSMEMWMKVESGKGAYFNIQGANPLGDMFSIQTYFNADLTLQVAGMSNLLLTGNYVQNQWFKFNLNIDLNTNTWEILIDGVSQGTFANENNQIYAIDIYPVNSVSPFASGYYIDDFSTTYTAYSPASLNMASTNMQILGKVVGMVQIPKLTVRNLGTTPVTSFDVMVDYNGIQQTQNVTGVNIASLATYTFDFSQQITLASGSNALTVTVSNVNGGVDDIASDDAKSWIINPIVPAPGKVVVAEEGTGTWCQFCPRGAVFMDKYALAYENFIAPIAVHNGDPMKIAAYDAGMDFPSFPNSKVDRGPANDPSAIAPNIESQLLLAPTAFVTNGATWDVANRELKVSLTYDFQAAANNNYKVVCVLTENDVTGTSSNYNQQNAYASGSYGAMGGYENLPSPVPASQMVYDFVARAIMPSFNGSNEIFPTSIASGDTYTANFTFTLPSSWDENEIHIVGMLMLPTGKIDNAGYATIAEAVANGYVDGTNITSLQEMTQIDAQIKIYPNPANNYTNVLLNLQEPNQVQLKLIDITGKEIISKNYGVLSGAQQLVVPTSNLESGLYFVKLSLNSSVSTKRLVVK